MSLDQNLFTLNVTTRADEPLITELIDPQGTVHYRKERAPVDAANTLYSFDVFDPLSGSLLASVTAPSAISKHKTIELHNPSVPVGLKYTGTFTFKWTFKWEEHELEWKREECFLIRKPDPPVLVAITKEPPGKLKTKAVQILDYNLNRFDIHDRKGLEIVILSALLSFQDYSDEMRGGRKEEDSSPLPQVPAKQTARVVEDIAVPVPAPKVPPRPERSGPEKIAEMQKGDLGEIMVEDEGKIDDYARYCSNLLEGDNMLFVVLRSSAPTTVPKVLQVAHQTKRIRHKAGLDDELHQYVQYDVAPAGRKGSRVIKLDNAEEKDKYKPPESLMVYLSKIPMPELEPRAQSKDKGVVKERESGKAKEKGKGKEKEKEKSKNDKDRKRREKQEADLRKEQEDEKKKTKHKEDTRGRSLDRDSHLPKKPSTNHISAHRVHPNQPSPSLSQINNPTIYAAPKPRPPRASPSHVSSHQRTTSSTVPPPNLSAFYGSASLHPTQRPISASGDFLRTPRQSAEQRAGSPNPNSTVNGLLNRLKPW